jgi:hypothetical protein
MQAVGVGAAVVLHIGGAMLARASQRPTIARWGSEWVGAYAGGPKGRLGSGRRQG